MIRINAPEDGYTIADLAGVHWYSPKNASCIARLDDDGVLLGGVLYEKWRKGGSVELHFAATSKLWVSRTLLWAVFDYPFNQLECRKVLGFTPSSKVEALAILERLGFTTDVVIDDVFPDGGSMIVSHLYRQDCRWLTPPRDMERIIQDG